MEVDVILDRIKKCKVKKQIELLRNETDKDKKSDLKKNLPVICFSGKFTKRAIKNCVIHSGFAILDFDHVEKLAEKKELMKTYPFVYAAFISPSGDGLKVLVKIPADIEKHTGYYKGLQKLFPDLDPANKDISRACFESVDSDIYINPIAIEFTEYVEVLDSKINNSVNTVPIQNNYSKADIALRLIRNSADGQKHVELLKAAKLMGGYIAGALIDESEAVRLLETEISNRGCSDFEAAKVTIKKGIEYGKADPIQEKYKQDYVSKTQSIISVENEDFSFLAQENEIKNYLQQWRDGSFVKGLSTGLPSLDKYFVFKRGNFNVINGFDNVGKSTALWYKCLLSAMFCGWSWIINSSENRNGTVVKKLIEFYYGIPINKLSESQFNSAKTFIDKHFTIISNEFLFNYKDILNITEKLLLKKKYDGLLVDPYNALKIDLSNNSKLSTHEYHYEAASEMQVFSKKKDICIYLNCHVITGAMRLQKGETVHRAPGKADTEGGGKFSNKADDFMTFHREVQDPENFTKMQIHVRKIKEVETGGGYTPYDSPYILEMQKGMCAYADINGFDPIYEYWNKQGKQITIPNTGFLAEKEERKPLVPSKYDEENFEAAYTWQPD